jgi:L-lactate dehydrogenase (cytochrome)
VSCRRQVTIASELNLRQLDSVTSTIRALPRVVDAVQGKVPVFMDGGIRSGPDVLKALALGAKACFLGRAWAYALGAAGESGVRDMLDILREELRAGMILTGCSDVNRATPDLLLKD